jgi:Fe-S cluster assembly protein SufD
VHLFVGAGADVSWITHHVSLHKESSWSNGLLDIALEDGARCHHTHLVAEENNTWHFDALRATLKKESHLESFHVCMGGRAPRLDARLILCGENGNASLQGLWALDRKKQAHMYTTVEHHAPVCRSMQRFKGVLKDFSQSSFEGKIFVKPIAQKTEAYQINNNLILNDGAMAYSKPNLEIFADDVKASHGATVAQLNEQELFYLKTRGLSEALSKKLLVTGFCKEILDQIPYQSIKEQLQKNVYEMLQ